MTQPLTERLRAFAARWRKSTGRRGGYGDEIYEIDTGAPSHVVLTVQMVEQSADLIDALEATQAELVEALEPFVELAKAKLPTSYSCQNSQMVFSHNGVGFTFGDLRQAEALLAKLEAGQ